MRVDVIMWPTASWPEARRQWEHAEDLGFGRAWLFDHVAWRDVRPWFDPYSTLAAAAAVTARIGLGTLVTSPNFRHPVLAAKAALAIDDISGGRFTLGVGAGGGRSDVHVLGENEGAWTPRERADRFAEWVTFVDLLLRQAETTHAGPTWSTHGTWLGGREPRLDLAVAATGPRGLRLAARFAQTWVTQDLGFEGVRDQAARLAEACAGVGRDPADLRRLIVLGSGEETPLASLEAFHDCVGRYAELGFTACAVHWPRADGPFRADPGVLEAVASAYR